MSGLSQTRAIVQSIAQHAPTALTRHRALLLDRQLTVSTTIVTSGMLRQIVIAIRDLVGPAWLTAHASDPAISAFTALDSAPKPPQLPILDHTLARCLHARFGPGHPDHSAAWAGRNGQMTSENLSCLAGSRPQ